ncbi:site-specific integrase [Methanohalophilus profundi]|uniref:site-specific integrase n=1 Tax=Methanohalophilus profundi TaxID=2138083 RepID=UPI0013ED978A|nr:site-specific integrase [Methanohalophilus profundi]
MDQLNILAYKFGKDLDKLTLTDMYRVVAEIERSDKRPWTKHGYKVTIKRFFRWLNGGNDPETTSWIKTAMKQHDKMLPDELLTEDEVKKMIETAQHPRDKAMIAFLYDSGSRVGEMGTILIKHINFDKYGATVILNGKTGMRRVRLIFSPPYIASWLDIHPDNENPNANVWINLCNKNKGKHMNYRGITKVIKRTAERAGIKKRVYNHLFRHSRATELANVLTQAQLESHLGWIHGTDMSATYIHLSGQSVDDALLNKYGLKEDEGPKLNPIKCPRCNTTNGPTAGFCSKCGMTLTAESMVNIQDSDDEVLTLLMDAIKHNPDMLIKAVQENKTTNTDQ